MKPLHGISESGLHWYHTYMSHHVEELCMHRSRFDPCALLRRDYEKLTDMVLLQVDDTLGFCDPILLEDEEHASQRFKSKPRAPLTDKSVSFNSLTTR